MESAINKKRVESGGLMLLIFIREGLSGDVDLIRGQNEVIKPCGYLGKECTRQREQQMQRPRGGSMLEKQQKDRWLEHVK